MGSTIFSSFLFLLLNIFQADGHSKAQYLQYAPSVNFELQILKSEHRKNRILTEKRLNSKFLQNLKMGNSAKRQKYLILDRHIGTMGVPVFP